MYSPYGNTGGNYPQQGQYQDPSVYGNIQHPQPQHAPFQHQPQNAPNTHQQPQGGNEFYNNFFQDPASSMAAQFAKNSLGQSNDYIQQNFGAFIPPTSNLNYYFQISNSYVLRKLRLILFPFRNKNWARLASTQGAGDGTQSSISYAPPSQDINAPDLYIPFMSYITYVLLWALFQGLKGDFHPQLFGYLASQALACLIFDIFIFRVGLYLLNCVSSGSFWDIVSFSGYKYVPIIVLLILKQFIGVGFVFYGSICSLAGSFALFLMRSLRFLVLPPSNSVVGSTATNSIPASQRRLRLQFLFVYSFVVQLLVFIFMNL
ncbi:Protein transport protein yif1 [Yamadazyma tenuis]|uniref:Protein YIF1 n=1 Tax=Candida tenuis (strain ATCC 10573 / BCRC 21748 / CBS 615 / JCM 9827 / NBRC 10315 / NRRL Y-1498 / VKM Y-70) TaxID=590646 RepID=G3B865_CANTC|nr:uncharacterized protein CANTEDRAFT_115159 [Yamadazyma tenuis ATCC 10573]EGV61701.1 hypothetical protein CANTEDRAFT_115159 [Yamadazyma tenuis ATCC 10573]WEJ92930.1 Protein transport protein yif1 [Yamadazyma tenuis]